jgi:hypothetical protein
MLQVSGDLREAMRLYRDLDTAWKNADPDFPPLQRLQRYERKAGASEAP